MAFHNHLSRELTPLRYAEQQQQQLRGDNRAVLRTTMDQLAVPTPSGASADAGRVKDGKDLHRLVADAAPAVKPTMAGGGGPTWLNGAILRQQAHHYADGSFLHLQTTSGSSASPVAAGGGGGGAGPGSWFPRPSILQRSGSEDEVPVSNDPVMAGAISGEHGGGRGHAGGELGESEAVAQGSGGEPAAGEATWMNARYKAEILAHPLYEQLLAAHVACLRIATPVDQLPRIDAQLGQSQQIVSKYSLLGNNGQMPGDDKELDRFMTHYVLLLCSFKEQLQQHVRVHAMEAVMACWELEQSLQSLTGNCSFGGKLNLLTHHAAAAMIGNVPKITLYFDEANSLVKDHDGSIMANEIGVSPGEGTGATMSDDEQVDGETNLFDGSFDGPDSMGFGPLIPSETERSLMERVRRELKHELKQGYKTKIVDIREEILRKRRAGKLPGDSTSALKAWWQSHSKWPYPTEDDKVRLVQETGLQLKQINNWFINQRKRNWHSNPSSSSSTSLKSKRKRFATST
ncbi:homeobox protein [Musa troglodytarum]|uniref:Homeobox protein n=1 Tax=Musa troglodytarum TaxID=320322 RepID=A0A9E7E978_9LILI|nr:homeobox protein [Musa troglodytarum]